MIVSRLVGLDAQQSDAQIPPLRTPDFAEVVDCFSGAAAGIQNNEWAFLDIGQFEQPGGGADDLVLRREEALLDTCDFAWELSFP